MQMYLGFGGVLAVISFLMLIFALSGGGDYPFLIWVLLVVSGLGSWHCFQRHKQLEEERMIQKQDEMDHRLKQIPNYKPSQRYTSLNGNDTLSIDEKNKRISFISLTTSENRVYSYHDILKSEILTDGISVTSTNRASQLGGALLGGLLAGGVGAIIGGLSGSTTSKDKVKKIELNVIVNDTVNPVHKITFLDSEFSTFSKDSQEYKDGYNTAYHCHQLIGVLIKQADNEDKRKEQINKQSQDFSVADELRKLQQLKNEGILTESEFDMQKKKLIGG